MNCTATAEFCYICFESTKHLKDLLKSEEECLELMAKLRVCVSEVNWNTNKKLLVCDKCIKNLKKAHEFKKQCIQSSETLKLYMNSVEKTKDKKQVEKREEPLVLQYLNLKKDDKSVKKPPPLLLKTTAKPEIYPKYTKIILTNQNNSFQNVFLNILPQNLLNKNNTTNKKPKVVPIPQVIQLQSPKANKDKDQDEVICKLKEGKTEEVSVEIDPLDFNMEDKSESKPLQLANTNFRPILPKTDYDYTNEEKMEFFNSGHFLLQDFEKSNRFFCEKCLMRFESPKALHDHIKQVHSSQYPYKCEFCGMEFAAKEVFKTHLSNHVNETSELMSNSITLLDFTNNSPKVNDLLSQQRESLPQDQVQVKPEVSITKASPPKEQEVKCDECDRVFLSEQGLFRHKGKIHKNHQRKKYFIKGMKTAKCDICNRMFSTHSYMNLHRKLHERRGEWRRKIYKQDKKVVMEQDQDDENEIDDDDSMITIKEEPLDIDDSNYDLDIVKSDNG